MTPNPRRLPLSFALISCLLIQGYSADGSLEAGSRSAADEDATRVTGAHRRSLLGVGSSRVAAGNQAKTSPPSQPPPPARSPPKPKARSPPKPKPPPKLKPPRSPKPSPKPKPSPPRPPPNIPPVTNNTTEAYYTVCSAVQLLSPLDPWSGQPVYTFGDPVDCRAIADLIALDWTTTAAMFGASISEPFSPRICSGAYRPAPPAGPDRAPVLPNVTLCGAFKSLEDAAKLKLAVQPLLTRWSALAVGSDAPLGVYGVLCPPRGYEAAALVWPTEGPAEDPPLLGYQKTMCLIDDVPAGPPPPGAQAPVQCALTGSPTTPFTPAPGLRPAAPANSSTGAQQRALCMRVVPNRLACNVSSSSPSSASVPACCSPGAAKVVLPLSDACSFLYGAPSLAGVVAAASLVELRTAGGTAGGPAGGRIGLEISLSQRQQALLQPSGADLCIPVPQTGPCAYPKSFCATPDCEATVVSHDSACCRGTSKAPPPAPAPAPGTSSPGVSVCTYLAILVPNNPGATVPLFPFNVKIDCDVYTDLIASAWSVAAATRGARITTPFTTRACTPGSTVPRVLPSIQVCGAFATADEAALLQDDLGGLVAYWSTYIITGQLPTSYSGSYPAFISCIPGPYSFRAEVWGENASLTHFSEVVCSGDRIVPPRQ